MAELTSSSVDGALKRHAKNQAKPGVIVQLTAEQEAVQDTFDAVHAIVDVGPPNPLKDALRKALGLPVQGTAPLSSLDQLQVGGDHYKKHRFTPWHVIDEYGLGFYDGNALKYVLRAKEKGGTDDLRKARHYLDKLIELHEKYGGAKP